MSDIVYENLTTEDPLLTEFLCLAENIDDQLYHSVGLLVHEIRNICEKTSDAFAAEFLFYIVSANIESGRFLTGQDLFETFPTSNNRLFIDPELIFASAEQFLCVRTLVDNSLAHGGCEVKYNPLENAFEIIDLAGVDWKDGYWEEINQAYSIGKNWEDGQRLTKANRGKSIVATIMGIRGYGIPTEVRDGSRKGIKLVFGRI